MISGPCHKGTGTPSRITASLWHRSSRQSASQTFGQTFAAYNGETPADDAVCSAIAYENVLRSGVCTVFPCVPLQRRYLRLHSDGLKFAQKRRCHAQSAIRSPLLREDACVCFWACRALRATHASVASERSLHQSWRPALAFEARPRTTYPGTFDKRNADALM